MERMCNQFDVLARGRWAEGAVATRPAACTFDPPADVLRQIDLIWQRELSRPGIHLFDGPMCRLERFLVRGAGLILWTSGVTYRQFVGTNLHNAAEASRHGGVALANPIGLSCALLSADGFVMLGRRSARVAYYPNRVHPFAGCMEPSPGLDVFEDMRRELAQELLLTRAECGPMHCLGIVRDLSILQPELIFMARSTLSREQIERREVEVRLKDSEHRAWVAIPVPALADVLRNVDEFTPIALATVTLAMDELGA